VRRAVEYAIQTALVAFVLAGRPSFLYFALGGPLKPIGIYVGSLDSAERKLLVRGGSNARYASGHLLFLRDTTLTTQPFDPARLETTGDAVPIAEQIQVGGASGATGAFTVSDNGVLVYHTGSGDRRSQLTWYDRTGKPIGLLGDQADYDHLELSPDGTRATVSVLDPAQRTRDIWIYWIYDVARGLRSRFTFDSADELGSVWSPDASRIAFNSRRNGTLDIFEHASSGAGGDEPVLVDKVPKFPSSWSRDGRFLLYMGSGPGTGNDLLVLPLTGDRKPFPFLQTPFTEMFGQFSPDGRWVAYVSDESRRQDVYIAPFPGPGGKWLVSTGGGTQPRWRADGLEVFYLAPDNKMMAAEVRTRGAAAEVDAVRALFDVRARPGGSVYAVSADGKRFLVNSLSEQTAQPPMTVVVNWPGAMRK
jgi:hypothetical protein